MDQFPWFNFDNYSWSVFCFHAFAHTMIFVYHGHTTIALDPVHLQGFSIKFKILKYYLNPIILFGKTFAVSDR